MPPGPAIIRAARRPRAAWLLVCAALAPAAGAQTPAEVLAMPDDTAKVLALSDLCFAYRRTDADSAASFGHAALQLAQRLHFRKGQAQALNDLAILDIDRSRYAQAESLLGRSLALRTRLADSAGMAAIHNKLGIIHQARFRLEDALEEDLKALAIYERTGPPAHEATLLNNIAILQFNLKRLPEALATHRRAAAIRERIGDGPGLAASRGNMANVEAQLGDTATAAGHYREAIGFFRAKGLEAELAVQLHNLAGIEMAQGKLEQAARDYGEALALRTAAGDRKGTASSLVGLGGTRLRQGRTREARTLLANALHISREVGARSEEMQALLDLARLHARLNPGDSAFSYFQQYSTLKDSVFNAELGRQLAEAETRFETEKKERRIQAQRLQITELEAGNERRRFWLVLAIGMAALALMGALLLVQVRQRRARARHDAALIREREAGLQGVLQATDRERKRIAAELHDGIGQQLTGLKYRLEELAAPVSGAGQPRQEAAAEALAIATDAGREVRAIAHALMPQALEKVGLPAAAADMLQRSLGGAGITHELEHHGLEARLPPAVEVGVFRVMQELVQNTMKHAEARHVNLQLLKNREHLVFIYEDDGKGITGTPHGSGIGLHNIRERVRALHGTFSFANGEQCGVLATLRVPLAGAAT